MTESDFQAFEAVGALIVVLDTDDRIIYWNHVCSDLTGYAVEEVRGRRFWDFLLIPEEVGPVRTVMEQLRTAPGPTPHANYWVTKTGERRWIAWSHTATKGPEGVRYFIKTGIDRTERKLAEDTLSGIIGIAADAIISIDDEQRIIMYNGGAATIFGWSPAEVLGKPFDILLPARLRGAHARHLRDFANGDETTRHMGQRMPMIVGLRKTGEEFPAQAAISKLDVGDCRVFTVVLRDITDQRRREGERELLAELAASLAETLDHDDILTRVARLVVRELAEFCIVDLVEEGGHLRRTKVLHRDPAKLALCELFRRLPVDGQHAPIVSSVVATKQSCLMPEVSSQYLESFAPRTEYAQALRELAPRSLIAVPLVARGTLLGTLVLVSTHASRRYQGSDLRLTEELGHRAALAIDNARLFEDAWRAADDLREANAQMVRATIRAQELSEEAEEAKELTEGRERELRQVAEFREMFIGIVGHDLRNPLGSILMTTGLLLRRGNLDAQAEKAVARIIKSSQRMTRMIAQLLDLTRARLGGGFPLEPKPTDLRDVCRSVVEEFEAAIQLDATGDLTGTWDADRLVEALSNITGNAIEHATPGTAVVVRAHAEGPEVVVEIINQGNPIPGDVLPFIFEPFRRAQQHEVSATGNLGLGLYIAKQIVNSGCGSLTAYSVDGTTTFLMRMPRDTSAVSQPHSAPEKEARPPDAARSVASSR